MRVSWSNLIRNCFGIGVAALFALALIGIGYTWMSKLEDHFRIYDAVERADLAEIRTLLHKDRTLVSSRDREGETPLFRAPNKKVAELLLANGADVDARDNRRFTPLHVAAGGFTNREDVVESLLAHGADVNARNDLGMTPLFLTMLASGQTRKIELLARYGADLNATDNHGETPLHEAAAGGHKDEVVLLLAKGADPNGNYSFGCTPASLAKQNNHADVVAVLHQHGGWE